MTNTDPRTFRTLETDASVFSAYGWSPHLSDKEILEKAAGVEFGRGEECRTVL